MAYRKNLRNAADKLEQNFGELQDERAQEVDPDEWSEYRDDPVGFIIDELTPDERKYWAVKKLEDFGLLDEKDKKERIEYARDYQPNDESFLDYGFGPWERQKDIADSVVDERKVVVRSCNSAGKDWLAAQLALWWVYAHQGLVLFTGPTERQVVEVCMKEVASAWKGAGHLPGKLYQTALKMGQGENQGILAFTSTSASKLTGFHGPRVFAVLTEAQEVEEFAYEGMISCATGAHDRILALGNPLKPSGPFYHHCMKEEWRDFKISAEEHPNVQTGRTIIDGAVTKEWVEDREEWKDNNPQMYRARVMGDFPDSGEGSIVNRSWVEQAFGFHDGYENEDEEEIPGAVELFEEHDEEWAEELGDDVPPPYEIAAEALLSKPVITVDPSRYGTDRTVASVRYGPLILEFESWKHASTMESSGRIGIMADEYGVRDVDQFFEEEGEDAPFKLMERIIVDCIGPGQGIYDRLEEQGYNVGSFKAGKQASRGNREDYADARSEAYWGLRTRLANGEIALPRERRVVDELAAIQWSPTSASKIRVNKKKEIRNSLGRSPDYADNVMMSFYEGNVPFAYRDIMI